MLLLIPLTAASTWVKVAWLPCCIHVYTVYTSIGGKGRCHTGCDLRDHRTQARRSAGKRSTPALKPMRKSPKQDQSVAPQTGPWSNKNFRFDCLFVFTLLCHNTDARLKKCAHRHNVILGIIKADYNIVKTRPSNFNNGNINVIEMGPTHA